MARISRVLMTGAVAPFADAYRTEMLDRGYTPLSTVNELRQVAVQPVVRTGRVDCR